MLRKKDGVWRTWFAWHPVKDEYGNWHWLERIICWWNAHRWVYLPLTRNRSEKRPDEF